jgi:hypothetical protein
MFMKILQFSPSSPLATRHSPPATRYTIILPFSALGGYAARYLHFQVPYPVNAVNPVQSKMPPVTHYPQLFHHFAVNDFALLSSPSPPPVTRDSLLRLRRSSNSLNINI